MAHNVQYIVDDTNKLMSLIFRACADKAHQAIQLGCFSPRSGVEDGISVNIEYANKRVKRFQLWIAMFFPSDSLEFKNTCQVVIYMLSR